MNSESIKLQIVGKVTGGKFDGRYIYIKKYEDNSDDYLIFVSDNSLFSEGTVHDYWAENESILEAMVKELSNEICWMGPLKRKLE